MDEKNKQIGFLDATGIIVGHGVGSGILAVPYVASKTGLKEFIITVLAAYAVNLLLHLMVAELSYNNKGAQFITCFENELFSGKMRGALIWISFGMIGFSVLINISCFITGSAAVLNSWFGIDRNAGMIIYYAAASLVVYFGLKIVGIFEKYSVLSMSAVILVLMAAVIAGGTEAIPGGNPGIKGFAALYSMVSFSLSAVMSVPQVVKGLGGDRKKICLSIAAGMGVNTALIVLVTLMTLMGAGTQVSTDGALVDLANKLGGWAAVVGYVFSLLALSTSFWANALNLRDIISEKLKWDGRICWVLSTLPPLFIALLGAQSFVGFTRLAGVIQVLSGVAVIAAYAKSRQRVGSGELCGPFGTRIYRILVLLSAAVASIGAIIEL